jgi:hypothetical protein
MIETIAGIAIGWLVGYKFGYGFANVEGLIALIAFIAVADELVAALADKERKIVSGLLRKGVFCWGAVAVERMTGAPLGAVVLAVMVLSIFRNLVWRTSAVRGREAW